MDVHSHHHLVRGHVHATYKGGAILSARFALVVILLAWIFQILPPNMVAWLLVAWCILILLEPLQPPRRQGYQPTAQPLRDPPPQDSGAFMPPYQDDPPQSTSGIFPYQDEMQDNEEEVQR